VQASTRPAAILIHIERIGSSLHREIPPREVTGSSRRGHAGKPG
jgi:hypothetical protein